MYVCVYVCTRVCGGSWIGLVLWHIDHSRLFYANSFLYIYIKYRICKHRFASNILKAAWVHFFQSNGFKCCYIKVTIYGGARGVMVIVVGNGQDDTSANPG